MLALLLSAGVVSAVPGAAPEWSKPDLKALLAREEVIRGLPEQSRDAEFARLVGDAYHQSISAGDSIDGFARRVLKIRDPAHPAVKQDQWLLALSGRFWSDVARRCDVLARFELQRNDRLFFETKAKQAQQAADTIASMVQTKVEGAGGFIAKLPTAEARPAGKQGCEAFVRDGRVTVKVLERATFPDDAPPPNIERTPSGAIKEFAAAMKQFNLEAQTLGMVDRNLKKGQGQLRIWIPSASPAIYLNELARAAKEGSMHTLYVMVHRPDGELGEVPFTFSGPKTKPAKGKKAPAAVPVRCRDQDPMQACVERALDEAHGAPMIYRVE